MNAEDQHRYLSWQKSNKRGKFAAGIIVILFGVLFLLKETGVHLPSWTFGPGTILIGVSLIVLIKHKFKALIGYILGLVGTLLVLKECYPDAINMKLVWPVLVILAGIGILFRSQRKSRFHRHHHDHHRFHRENWKKRHQAFFEGAEDLDNISQDDFIDAVSIFGGLQKNVVSKQFRGADIVTIFGGNEINLSQADFTDQIVMDVTNIFGGTTLTVPNNWEIKSEVVSIFGSIDDKRPITPKDVDAPSKVVLLRGSCMFGGIEINSYN